MRKFIFLVFVLILATSYWLLISGSAVALTEAEIQAQEAKWQAELEATEKEIAEWENVLTQTKKGTASLENEAAILQAKINEAKAFIKNRQIQIQQLTNQIDLKTATIEELEIKIERGKESLAEILRSTNELDSYSLVEVMLSNKNLSQFFENIDAYNTIKIALENQFNEIRELQNKTDTERKRLDQKRAEEADRKAEVEVQKKKVEIDEQEKQRLININKNQEKTYEQVIAEKEKKAAQIRAALFSLRDTDGIPFGDALKYAEEAQRLTGVRPAFLLGVLQQESNIGKNVGSCVITDLSSGRTQSVNSGKIFENGIHPTRDLPVLQEVLSDLGRDPKMTKVSCPISVGYGGAMGPAQFIPSTWKLYIDKLEKVLIKHPDPWNPRDAFIASAMLLADLGASNGGYTAEHTAAAKYYAGGGWKTRGQSYANSVMGRAQTIQLTMIDPLEGF
ncbi:MAG: lytic murein transglycosylase [Candidatus Zambryskibacteria bacterium]|nr:lytic murein transglycosylase [Candidatus Zambryskibacteria bacterium]